MISWAALWVLGFLLEAVLKVQAMVWLGFSPSLLFGGELLSLVGLVSYPFLHQPSIPPWHLLFNCLLFFYLAPEVERMNPGRRFVKLLAIAALAGAAAMSLLHLLSGKFPGPVYGGSGLVTCVFAYMAAIYPGLRVSLLVISVRLLPLFLVLTSFDLLRLIADLAGAPGSVSSEVHLAGAVVGWTAAGGWQRFPLIAGLRQRRAQRRDEQKQQNAARDEQELDRILAKISREGIGSLSPAERKFLEQRSKR